MTGFVVQGHIFIIESINHWFDQKQISLKCHYCVVRICVTNAVALFGTIFDATGNIESETEVT